MAAPGAPQACSLPYASGFSCRRLVGPAAAARSGVRASACAPHLKPFYLFVFLVEAAARRACWWCRRRCPSRRAAEPPSCRGAAEMPPSESRRRAPSHRPAAVEAPPSRCRAAVEPPLSLRRAAGAAEPPPSRRRDAARVPNRARWVEFVGIFQIRNVIAQYLFAYAISNHVAVAILGRRVDRRTQWEER